MVRLGWYTGKLYGESIDISSIKECCTILNFKEPVYEDEPSVTGKAAELKTRCFGCNGCEESKNI